MQSSSSSSPTSPSNNNNNKSEAKQMVEEESDQLYEFFKRSIQDEQQLEEVLPPKQVEKIDDQLATLFAEEDPDDPDYNCLHDLVDFNFDDILELLNEGTKKDSHGGGETSKQVESGATSEHGCPFTPDQAAILYHQMQFHVQTVTQTWMLSSQNQHKDEKERCDGAKKMLIELDQLAHKTQCGQQRTLLNSISNLQAAVHLITTRDKEVEREERKCDFTSKLSTFSRNLMMERSDIFVFKWALPTRRPHPKPRQVFSNPIDSLIAFAIDDYFSQSLDKKLRKELFDHIHTKLPAPKESIVNRVKSLRCRYNKRSLASGEPKDSKFSEWWSNPIVYYFREQRLPPFNFYFTAANLDKLDRLGSAPAWYGRMLEKDEEPLQIVEKKAEEQVLSTRIVPKPMRTILPNGIIFSTLTPVPSVPENLLFNLPSRPKRKRKCKSSAVKRSKSEESFAKKPADVVVHKTESDDDGQVVDSSVDDQNVLQKSLDSEHDITEPKCDSTPEDMNDDDENPPDDDDDENGSICDIDKSAIVVEDEVGKDQYETVGQSETILGEDDEPEDQCEEVEVEEDEEEFGEDELDDDGEMSSVDKVETAEDEVVDDENDLMALMKASWTAVSAKNDGDSSAGYVKRKAEIVALQRISSIHIIKCELEPERLAKEEEQRKDRLIHYYLKRAQKTLLPPDFVRFLELLTGLMSQTDSQDALPIKAIYTKIKQFLTDLHSTYAQSDNLANKERVLNGINELTNLLVVLLDFVQAQQCGKAFEYLSWKRVFDFMRMVEHYLGFIYPNRNQQHSCVQRLVRSLNQLSQQPLNKSKIKSTVSKILNGHPMLMDEFSSLFLDDPPSAHLVANSDDFEEFVLTEEDFDFENVDMPTSERDLKYGTSECPCEACHPRPTDSTGVESSSLHCPSCSIRFISGRLYLPQLNSSTKKLQLVEYVKCTEPPKPLKSLDFNNQQHEDREKTGERRPWTIAEDRILLEACRSIILNARITKLTNQVFHQVATSLAAEQFNKQRTSEELAERLRQLVDMMTANNHCD